LAAATAKLADEEALRVELTTTAAAAGKRIDELTAEVAALKSGAESVPAVAVAAAGPAASSADEAAAVAEHRLTELELRVADDEGRFVLGGLGGFRFFGNLVTAIYYRNASDVVAAGDVVDANDDFSLMADGLEMDVEATFGTFAVLRADLDVLASLDSGGGSDFRLSLEQAYGEVRVPVLRSLPIRLGRWSDELGWESVDRAALWGFTHSNVFTLMQPGLLSGLRVGYPFTDWLDVAAFMVNGIGDNVDVKNLGKTFGGSVEVGSPRHGAAHLRSWKVNLGVLAGSEQPTSVDPTRNYLDATLVGTLAFDFRIGNLFVGGQVAYLQINDGQLNVEAHQGRNDVFGAELGARYVLSMRLSGWVRYDVVVDRRGVLSDRGTLLDGAGELHALGVGLGVSLAEGARIGLEYKAELFLATPASADGPECNVEGERRPCGRTSGEDGAAHTAVLHFTYEF
ncbi:MAG TPA: outer membrane beta-barrel protein, partial [Myxococcota bacterium]|nr:outer membrane beta-barrel protein [Myxococcota bacterium]